MPPLLPHLSQRWSRFVIRHWRLVLLLWLAAVIVSRVAAPTWKQVAYDGDFEHLPATTASVAGTKLLDAAFPTERPRSQFMILFARDGKKIGKRDQHVAMDLSRRLRHRLGCVYVRRALASGWSGKTAPVNDHVRELVDDAMDAFDRSIELDTLFYEYFEDSVSAGTDPWYEPRVAIAYWDRARLHDSLGKHDLAASDREIALALDPEIESATPIEDRDRSLDSMLDILSWDDERIGKRLSKRDLRLVVIRLENEFLATGNIELMESLDELIDSVRAYSLPLAEPGLRIEIAGSAAIGGETLIAARDAIQYTEWFTVILIMIILAVVYRAPALVAVPLVSIGVAVICATGLVSALASAGQEPGMEWIGLKVFTTSKIFVVVILFGAGTDYCLFLIARLREEAGDLDWGQAVEQALSKVMGALLGSAFTTVVGLWMMWVGNFGKFHYVGPIIAICLLVGLAVCTTLTPALLYALGPRVFWPGKLERNEKQAVFWEFIALVVTQRPKWMLVAGIGLLAIPAVYGFRHEGDVSYDITTQLNAEARSREGVETLSHSYSLGESNPIVLLLLHEQPIDPEVGRASLRDLVAAIYEVDGVRGIRYLEDPLGDNPPGKRKSVFAIESLVGWVLKQHRVSRRYFTSDEASYANRLIRLDVMVDEEPFGEAAAEALERVVDRVEDLRNQFLLVLTPEIGGIEATDLAIGQIQDAISRLEKSLPASTQRRSGVKAVDWQLSTTGMAWFDYDDTSEVAGRGEVLVTMNDRSGLVPFANRLMEVLRNGDPELGIDRLPDVKARLIPSPIADCEFQVTGTSMAMQDLKQVTTEDTTRIKIFVVGAVLTILLMVVWRVGLSIYLIATVLLSYYATLGLTVAFFRTVYGDQFVGLDWKLPLFLFVILVAVGQDYNVYLVTRVLEEQKRGGRLAGLRRAIIRTGGIITSCGVVMAGTFFAMTASAWAPELFQWVGLSQAQEEPAIMLRGVVELGFALGLGVLVDTFYVRTILVPAYMAAFDQRIR
ncbi:MMPL family transporter [Rosistilla oblonga]|uniref:MMPL family transporter n=1 Tax=Rosistilla oblonga TaxID=2527990 RepID=UPI003A96EBE8